MTCKKLWMTTGTAKKRKNIPVHAIVERLQLDAEVLELLPSFHALRGCDTTSLITGRSKKTCWSVFKTYPYLLRDLGNSSNINKETVQNAGIFICKAYEASSDLKNINELRVNKFHQGTAIASLPPTRDALRRHMEWSHYQALVWRQAHLQHPQLPPPETMGWTVDQGTLSPKLMSLPSVPKACMEFISCSCSTDCKYKRCSCRRDGMPCLASCKRKANCMNVTSSVSVRDDNMKMAVHEQH